MLSDRRGSVDLVKNKIQQQQVLVKTINSPLNDDKDWLFVLRQLKNPSSNRPIKELRPEQNRSQIWDAKQQKWIFRNVTEKRGRKKDTRFIKETSLTLPPANGQMNYFGSLQTNKEDYIGIGFELGEDLILLKEKYIFEKNIRSNHRPWIFDDSKGNNTQAPLQLKSTTLDKLRERNNNAQAKAQVLNWNEVYCSPSLASTSFLFASYDNLTCRLNLLSKFSLVKKELGLMLPLFIMGPEVEAKEYSLHQQLGDAAEMFSSKDHQAYRNKIDLMQIVADYNQGKSKSKETLDDEMGALILVLYTAGKTEKLTQVLKAITLPLQSTKLDECLHAAIVKDDRTLASLFIDKGADINYFSSEKKSALAFAIQNQRQEIVANIMALSKERFQETTLRQSLLFAGNFEIESTALYYTQTIFDKQIPFDPNLRYWGRLGDNALHQAVSKKFPAVVKLICQHGGHPEKESYAAENKTTALKMAFKNNDYASIQAMLENAGLLLTPKQRGECVLQLLRKNQYALAKTILNLQADIDIQYYGAELATIIQNIAVDKTMSEPAKQTLALHFIHKDFKAASSQEGMMHYIKLLMTCSKQAKNFLFQPQQGVTNWFQTWQNQSVCSLWTAIMKLAKNRLLEIINQSGQQANDEVREFLSARRISFGYLSKTTSMEILDEKDQTIQAERISHEQTQLLAGLSRTYGFNRR